MEGKEKYTVSAEYAKTIHGVMGCIACHKGQNVDDMNAAHKDMIIDPSAPTDPKDTANPEKSGGVCALCHVKTAQKSALSMHNNLNGFRTSLANFSGSKNIDEVLKDKNHGLGQAFNGNCNNCHASCGQCHVSRPKTQKGGLLSMHKVEKEPPMDNTCAGCHSTRNGAEYLGMEGSPDVHYTKKNPKTGKNFTCYDCHQESNFHGSGKTDDSGKLVAEAKTFHEMTDLPKCADCHQDVVSGKSKTLMHNAHPKDTLACQVCHTTQYTNCFGCHVSLKDGKLGSRSEAKQTFKIGLNPNRDQLHPEKYVVVRHIPTVADSFSELGASLPNFDQVPNWKPAPVHNIQKYTPQNGNCNNCHGNKSIFLTKDDLMPNDSKANEKLLVKVIPAKK